MKRPVELIRVDKNNPDHVSFMWKVRTDSQVDKYLTGEAPDIFYKHAEYIFNTDRAFFIIVSEGQWCGYCQVNIVAADKEVGWAILPEFWSRGIGSLAVKGLIEWCRDWNIHYKENGYKILFDRLVLYVLSDNVRAIRTYSKNGFEEVSVNDNILKMEYQL